MAKGDLKVTIKDSDGNTFSRGWQPTVNRLEALRWTVESRDAQHCLEVEKITSVEIYIE